MDIYVDCFYISPIGEDGSRERKQADKILNHLVEPVCNRLLYAVTRADQIAEPGMITPELIKRLINAPLVIADITGRNPNVYYELAIRHFTGRPIVQIIDGPERLPFDIKDFRTVYVDMSDLDSVEHGKRTLAAYVRACKAAAFVENPITDTLRQLGITLPVISAEADMNLGRELERLSSRVAEELRFLRSERSDLLAKVLWRAQQAERVNRESIRKAKSEGNLTGMWESNLGLVRLLQEDEDLFGEYELNTRGPEFWGDIIGKVKDSTATFRWNWKNNEARGIGYWYVTGDELTGYWVFEHEVLDLYDSMGKALDDLDRTSGIVKDTGRIWELRRL